MEIVKEPCTRMSKECGDAMKKLAHEIRTMTRSPSSPNNPQILAAKTAARNLKSLLKSDKFQEINLLQMISVAAVASLLNEIVICVEDISDSVNELSSLAEFKNPKEKESISAASTQIIISISETSLVPSILEQDYNDHQDNRHNSRTHL